jgi:hypothetical protein
MAIRPCIVSFEDRHGAIQKARVDAESTYGAAALALKYWRTLRYVKGPCRGDTLKVQAGEPAKLIVDVSVQSVLDWLYVRPPKSADQKARIERLRGLLADDRR